MTQRTTRLVDLTKTVATARLFAAIVKEAKMQAGLKTCLSLVATLAVAAAIVFFVVRDAQAGGAVGATRRLRRGAR